MPLIKSGSKQAISQNISEMVRAGHPRSQAIAAALTTARRYGRQDGGAVPQDDISDFLRGSVSDIPPQKTFPDESDIALSKKYDTTYAQPIAGYAQGNASVGVVPKDLADFWLFNDMRIGWKQPITPEQSDEYRKAWIAAQRSPTAALGFDPHHLETSPPMPENLGYAGFYKPADDQMWFDPAYQSTPVHESFHRGLKMLRDEGMLPEHLGLKLGHDTEELIVRRLMHNYFGPVEMGRGPEGDRQVREALEKIPNSDIDTIEEAAQRLYAMKHPRGPRKFGGRTGYADGGAVGSDEVLDAIKNAGGTPLDDVVAGGGFLADVQRAGGVIPTGGDEVLQAIQRASPPSGSFLSDVQKAGGTLDTSGVSPLDDIIKQGTPTAVPAPAPAGPAQAKTWSDVPGAALQNLPGSAWEFGKNIAQPFIHPVETYENIRDLGHGILQKAGVMSGTEDVAKADAVGKFFVDRYGSLEAVKQTMATDPVGFLADASTLLSGGGSLAARAPGLIGKAGEVAATAGRLTDPLTLPYATAGAGATLAGKALAQGLGVTAGTGPKPIIEAARAGYEGGEKSRAFTRNLLGLESPDDVVHQARVAMDRLRKERQVEYLQGIKETGGEFPFGGMSFDKIDDALARMTAVKTFAGQSLSESTQDVRQAINDKVQLWKNLSQSDRRFTTPEGFDALKQTIDDIRKNTLAGSPQRLVANQAYDAVRQSIIDQVPSYAKTMKAYEDASNMLRELETTLSLPLDQRKTTIDTTLRKLQSTLRNNVNTAYGRREQLAQFLNDNGSATIMPTLAGQALQPWTARGLGKLGMEVGLSLAGLAGVAHAGTLGAGALYALATAPLYSPKLIGAAAQLAGKARALASYRPSMNAYQLGRLSNMEAAPSAP